MRGSFLKVSVGFRVSSCRARGVGFRVVAFRLVHSLKAGADSGDWAYGLGWCVVADLCLQDCLNYSGLRGR